ncbi:hypothetical protein ACVKN3_001680 [Luteibacter sp. PvP120]
MLVAMPLMDLPDPEKLPQRVLDLAEQLALVFSVAHPSEAMKRVEVWLQGHPVARDDPAPFARESLTHPLSSFVVGAVTEIPVHEKTSTELRALRDGPIPRLNPGECFSVEHLESYILAIQCHLCPERQGYRSGQVQSRADARSVSVKYPDPKEITGRMRAICQYWCVYHRKHPGLAATVLMLALMNLHPFDDGNGRAARAMFHWSLNTDVRGSLYLPLHELSALSRCGYLIRLRQAQYHGELEPILSYLLMCARGFVLP